MILILLIIAGCFLAGALTDVVWAKYTLAVNRFDPFMSSLWSGGIFLAGAVGVTAYVHNIWLFIPVAVGGMTATYVAVEHARRKGIMEADKSCGCTCK
jgi:hypothetical protein